MPSPRRRTVDGARPDLLEAAGVRGLPFGKLDERRVGEHGPDRTVLAGRGALAPGCELAGDGAGAGIELAHARQAFPDGLGVALVGRALKPSALLACPLQAPVLAEAPLKLVGKLEQVQRRPLARS